MTRMPAKSEPTEPFRWWKVTRFVGLFVLAVLCPFAALFMSPPHRRRKGGEPTAERELEP